MKVLYLCSEAKPNLVYSKHELIHRLLISAGTENNGVF